MQNVRIVLIETSHPGNIGAAARAMKNMAFNDLYLVKPLDFPSPIATARSSGAEDILERAVICQTLDEAVADCQLVIGASARLRSVGWPQMTPKENAEFCQRQKSDSQIAIVFGREDSGLSNDELDKCQYLLHIPTNPDYSSLNLAAAVQVICYELYQATHQVVSINDSDEPLATREEMEGFFAHMEATLTEIGFLKPPSCNKLFRRLRRLFNRAQPDKTDVNILRGVLSAAEGRKYEWQKRSQSK